MRASVVRPPIKPNFSEIIKQVNAEVCGKVISRPYFCFSKFYLFCFILYDFFFSFSLTWDHKFHMTSPLKVHNRFLKNHVGAYTPGRVLDHSCSRIVKIQMLDFSKFTFAFSSALCYCTAELLSSRRPPSSVRRPSVKPVFSEPVKHINAKFGGKVPFHHISRPYMCILDIQNLAFLIFYDFYYFFSSQIFMYTSRAVSTNFFLNNGEISNFGFCHFFYRIR